jgi:hypothetical protein
MAPQKNPGSGSKATPQTGQRTGISVNFFERAGFLNISPSRHRGHLHWASADKLEEADIFFKGKAKG